MKRLKNLSNLCFLIYTPLILLFLAPGNLYGGMYWVINTNDSGPGSLRDAMNWANLTVGPDTINFNIFGVGVHTIFPNSQLPILTDPSGVLIDGLTQGTASNGGNPPATLNLLIEIDGINAGAAHGIYIKSDNNIIQGLIINNFTQDGISIEAGPWENTINNQIYWNIIGLDPTGTIPKGNGLDSLNLWAGVRIHNIPAEITSIASDNFIVENLISSNYAEGVAVIGPQIPGDVFGNQIIGNYIGTDISGLVDLGNIHEGVCLCEGTHHNLVSDNLISGNDYDGVGIQGYNNELYPAPPIQTQFNIIENNIIGLAVDYSPLPNTYHGVAVGEYGPSKWGCADMNTIGSGNIIAYNGGNGVAVWEDAINNFNADGNQITQNSIFDNSGLGIDLQNDGLTFNDPADPDSGPNQELNYPVIDSALYNVVQTTVYGTIDIDTDPTQAIIEVFKAKSDPTNYGEGEIFLGSTNPVNAAGDWSVMVSGLNIGDIVTATTTDMYDNTSEFCNNITAQAGLEEEPVRYELRQNSPNPFYSLTTIQYAIPKTTHVRLSVFDVSGRLIKVLAEGVHIPSYYNVNWNGKDNSGRKVSQGVYFYRLEAKGYITSKKLIFLR